MELSETVDGAPTHDSSSQVTVILLEGALDLESIERLEHRFADAAWMGSRQVTLDMSGLRLIDEPAVAAVLRGIAALRAADVLLEIRYPSPMAPQLFEMCTPLQVVGIEFTPDPHQTGTRLSPSRTTEGTMKWA